MLEIETLERETPSEFWDKVRKLGPRNKNSIPMEIVSEDGTVNHSRNDMIEKWQNEFQNMYSGPSIEDFDYEFYNTKMIEKMIMNDEQSDPLHVSNHAINHEFTQVEVIKFSKWLKHKKAMGVDCIPNEVLKCKQVVTPLVHLFNALNGWYQISGA